MPITKENTFMTEWQRSEYDEYTDYETSWDESFAVYIEPDEESGERKILIELAANGTEIATVSIEKLKEIRSKIDAAIKVCESSIPVKEDNCVGCGSRLVIARGIPDVSVCGCCRDRINVL